jgi:hypothetical protein
MWLARPALPNGSRTDRQRIAAWFAGFLPAEQSQVSPSPLFTRGEPGVKTGGGSHAALFIGKLYPKTPKPQNPL